MQYLKPTIFLIILIALFSISIYAVLEECKSGKCLLFDGTGLI